jgi:hypothetical protein
MTENLEKRRTEATDFVFKSLEEARKRLASMDSELKLRDTNEIWEAYCDVEQAIEASKFIFGLHDRLGKARALKVSSRNDPKLMPLSDLVARYKIADSALLSAENAYRHGGGEKGIDCARTARDELKALLLGRRKMIRAKINKK